MKNRFFNPALMKLERKKGMATFIWFSIITAVLVFLACALYSVISKSFNDSEILAELGLKVGSMSEYFNAEALEMWVLPVSLFIACASISAVTSEFRNGSFELIYSLNMSRTEIVRTKLLNVILDTILINILACGFSALGLLIFSNGGVNYLNLLIYLLVAVVVSIELVLFIFAIALIGKKRVNMFSGVIVTILFYLFATLKNIGQNGETKALGYFSPLSTLSGSILTDGFKGIFASGIVMAVWGVISVLFFIGSLQKFKNDDLC